MVDEPIRQRLGQYRHGKLIHSLKNERFRGEIYRTRDAARADLFDYIARFYDTVRRASTIGYLSSVEFKKKVGLAQLYVHETGSRPAVLPARGRLPGAHS